MNNFRNFYIYEETEPETIYVDYIPTSWKDVDRYIKALEKTPFFASNEKLLKRLSDAERASENTQRANTEKTYDRVHMFFKEHGIKKNILDYGAGLGIAARKYNTHSFEPNAVDWKPTMSKISQIKGPYDGIVCLNVLNVLPLEVRNEAVTKIGSVLGMKGAAVIMVRSDSDVNKSNPLIVFGKDGKGGRITMGSKTAQYQKGFDIKELVEYVSMLLNGYYVIPFRPPNMEMRLSNPAVLICKQQPKF